jgi:peptide/nickel transport system substrate-binding protein
MIRKVTFLLTLMFPLLLVMGIVGAQDSSNVIRYPITVDPEHLNPFISDTIAVGTVNRNIYEGLTRYNAETGDIEPAIAESWEISEDGLVFTFTLRQGVLFHQVAGVELEDREVTADDVLWNYMVALNGDDNISIRSSDLAFVLGAEEYTTTYEERMEAGEEVGLILDDVDVPGLRVLDEYTFEIELADADRLFLINGMVSITSPEAYTALGEGFDSTPVGTGPYQIVEWLRQDRVVLEANPDYYIEGLPANDGIRFINYGDANTALLDYREGNVDFLFSFPSGQRDSIINEFGDEFNEKPGLHVRYWGFNMEDGYLADKPLVRLALAQALDKVTAWDIFDEGARFPATQGFLPPSMPASMPATVYNFDLESAANLLEEAGFPGGEGLEPIKIYLLESISSEAQVVVWAEALDQLGVPYELIIEDGSTYWDNIVTDAADVFTNGWAAGLIDPSDVFDYLVLNGNGSMRYDNSEVNALLLQARVELDEAAREVLYQQAHDIIMDDVIVIPSAYSKVSWLQKPWVSGFVPGGGGTYTAPLWNVELNRE